jgi:VWFA-related protein
MRLRLFSLILLAGAQGVVLSAAMQSSRGEPQEQQPAPVGTIRVSVRLVPVDVIVTDARDRPVLDLTKDSFTILENGRPQEIRHFSLQTFTAAPLTQPVEEPKLRRVPTLDLTPQARRAFLILMGRGRYQTPFKDVDALIRFVRECLLPQDLVAVFAYNRATDFTANHTQIVRVLEQYKKIHDKIELRLERYFSGLAAIYGSKAMPKALQPDIDGIFRVAGGAGSREVPPGRATVSNNMAREAADVSGTMQRIEALDEAAAGLGIESRVSPFDRLEVETVTDLPFEEYVSTSAKTMQDVQNVYTSIEYLRYMEGEKHLLLFSQNGLFLPRLDYEKSIAAAANDARVKVDTFQTGEVYLDAAFSAATPTGIGRGGLSESNAPTGNRSRTFAVSSLVNLSQLTGGRSSIHQDIGKALERVNETTRAQYLLGYYPTELKSDGRYRRIDVKVNRPGLRIAFRHGYFARDTIEPLDRSESLACSRISAAAAYADPIGDVPFRAATSVQRDASGRQQVRLELSIDVSSLRFEEVQDRHRSRIGVTVFWCDSKGRPVGHFSDTVDMNMLEPTYRRALREGLPFVAPIPLVENGQFIKILIYSYGNDRVGSQTIRLK